jgi:hypothetical protein
VSMDDRRIRDALTAHVRGLDLTTHDVERMHHDLEGRLGEGRPGRRPTDRPSWRLRWVAALAVAAAVAGVLWVRRPEPSPPPPIGVTLSQEIVGVWRGNAGFALVFRADGSARFFSSPVGVLRPSTISVWAGRISETAHYRVSGDTLAMSMQDAISRSCDYTFAGRRQGEGRVELTPVSQIGPGCVAGGALSGPFTMVRISPASPAGLAITIAADDPRYVVSTTNPLTGVWLLTGTGVVLVVDTTGAGAAVEYRIDHKGTVDGAADDHGDLTVPGPGQVRLKSRDPGTCADAVLKAVSAGDYSFYATVVTDPCNRFAGQTSLYWLLIQ